MNIILTDDLTRFIRKMVVDTKHYIVAKQGGVLGHNVFDRNSPITIQKKGHDVAMIWTGKMVASITCDVENYGSNIEIIVHSPQQYSSDAQLPEKNWDFLKITSEELNYYIQQIMDNLYIRR